MKALDKLKNRLDKASKRNKELLERLRTLKYTQIKEVIEISAEVDKNSKEIDLIGKEIDKLLKVALDVTRDT